MTESLTKSFEILLKNGEYAEAEKLLVSYMQDNPDDWDAKLLYGTCRMMQGDTETAKIIHQQASEYFESGKDIPEGQKSFWDKYKKLIFYGAVGAALVLTGVAYCGTKIMDICGVLATAGPEYYEKNPEQWNTLYGGPKYTPAASVKMHEQMNATKQEASENAIW